MANKGQATEGLSASAVSVIVLILVVAIGATVLQQVRTTQNQITTTITVTNETLNAAVATVPQSLTTAPSYASYRNTSVVVANVTQNPISILNYTFTASNGSVTPQWTGGRFNVTYQYDYTFGNSDYNITSQGLAALITYSNFFSVIVVVTIFAVVIGLFAFFAIRTSRQGGAGL